MKSTVCILMLAAASVYGAEEKKNEKRGLLGLGYGLSAPAPLLSHGISAPAPLFSHSIAAPAPLISHSIAAPAPLISHGVAPAPIFGSSLYGHGLGLYGHGLVGPSVVSHGVAPLAYGWPGHGILH